MSETKILETIGDVNITEADVDAFVKTLPAEQRQYASNPMYRQQILQQLVSMVLFSKYALEEKLDETKEYDKLLEDAKRDILAQLAVDKVVGSVSVSDDEINKFYEDNKASFKKDETVAAKHILVKDEEECNKVKAAIESGEKTFEEAASEFSTCPSKSKGGDLGEFGHGQMVAEFDEAAFKAEVDELVGPVKTQFGCHLIKVYDKKEAGIAPLDDVKAQIKVRLLQTKQSKAFSDKVAELHEKYCK